MKKDAGKQMLQEMREMIRVKNESPDIELQPYPSGIIFFVNEDFEQAVAAFQRAIVLKPDFAFSHYYLGRSLRRMERYQESIAAFEQALELNPLHAPSFAYLGNVLIEENRFIEAENCFHQALNLQFDNVIALSGLVKLAKNTNRDFNEIANLLKDAYFRGTKNPLLLMELFSIQALDTELCLCLANQSADQKFYHRAAFFYHLTLNKNPENKIIQAKIDETLDHLND
jgi:tetratricopeptide (TPR) repeat protein